MEEAGGGTLDGKPKEMEIVQEQDREGSQGSSSDSQENRESDLERTENAKQERRDLTPATVLPYAGPDADDLKREVDSVRRPRKSENLADARHVQIERAHLAKQGSNDRQARLDSRNQDHFQSSHGKKSGDSGHRVTAMIEQIEHERQLYPSHSQAHTMNIVHQDSYDDSYQPGMAPRVDRGFTIHDIGKQQRAERQGMESE